MRQQCCAYKQLQEFIAAGGKITAEDAPLVTKYPTKVFELIVCITWSGHITLLLQSIPTPEKQ